MAVAGRGRGRSQGAKLFAAVCASKTQARVAASLGVSTGIVAMWASGQRTPSVPNRQVVFDRYEIPLESWDEEARDPHRPKRGRKAAEPSWGARAVAGRLEALEAEATDTISRLREDQQITVLERVGAVEKLMKIERDIRKLRGEDAPEPKVMQHPRWGELRTAILTALREHPKALESVLVHLERQEQRDAP